MSKCPFRSLSRIYIICIIVQIEGSSPCKHLVFTKRVRKRERGYRREDKKIVANCWSPVPSHGRPRAETFRSSACSVNAPQYACSALPYWQTHVRRWVTTRHIKFRLRFLATQYTFPWSWNYYDDKAERNFAFVSIDREKCFLTLITWNRINSNIYIF